MISTEITLKQQRLTIGAARVNFCGAVAFLLSAPVVSIRVVAGVWSAVAMLLVFELYMLFVAWPVKAYELAAPVTVLV